MLLLSWIVASAEAACVERVAALTAPIEPAYGLKVEEAYRAAINGMRGDAILEVKSLPAGATTSAKGSR